MNQLIENRRKRIINNLLPLTGLKTKFNPPQTLFNQLQYYHTPGVSIAVINDYKIEWTKGYGMCDVRFKKKVAPETLFQAGSISKPIVALGVMRLYQEGKLNLDEDIHRYLSSWRVPANFGWQPKITIRQLLSHTAGLTAHGFLGYQSSETLPSTQQILNGELPANNEKVEVNVFPGTQTRYSGGGTIVMQLILEDLMGKPFPHIMRKLVFEPLGLTNSTYKQLLPNRLKKKVATAHPFKSIPLKGKFHLYPEMAAAGLWTSAADLARVGVELLKVLDYKKEHMLLAPKTIESMLLPQLDHQKVSSGEYVGLGFFCNCMKDGFHFGHSGHNLGFIAKMRFYRKIGKGAVVMLNSNEGDPLMDEIMRAIGKEYDWPSSMSKEITQVGLSNILDYTGTYLAKTGIQFRISVNGGSLTLQYGQQPPMPIFPSSELEFYTQSINADIIFEKDDKADIESIVISQEGNQIKAYKQITE